jgi:opacity protein-like surface antigen/outer membrane receptor protein involved in Fe transport
MALVALVASDAAANAQVTGAVQLPEVTVIGAKKPKPAPVARRAVRAPPPVRVATPTPTVPQISPAEVLATQNQGFDQARSNLYTTIGTTSDTLSHDTIQALPLGTNQPVERVVLQAPGVSQDSAASGLFHVRNDHANVQFRVNGVMLPDGVTGFSSILDTALIGNVSLVTGALPAEYGLRTVGLLDITTRTDIFNNSGSAAYYGGSRGTIQPSFDYGGTYCPTSTASGTVQSSSVGAACIGGVQYFLTGRYLQTTEGIENPLPTLNAIHDFSQQEKGFAYASTFVDPYTRLSLIAGTSTASFQIPNRPNQPAVLSSAFGVPGDTFNSAELNENQDEDTQFGVLALQRSINGFDGQLSYFSRYDNLHFLPDPVGDLLLNGVASDISRQLFSNGVQGDASYILTPAHTLRAGFAVTAEQAWVDNTSLVEATPPSTGTEPPFSITDDVAKLGWLAGVYVQDEWKITDQLTMNAGLRFDQMWEFVNANQLSPRLSFTYKPFENTTLHAGYARYFTPPVLVEAAPANVDLFAGTTGAPTNFGTSPVLPERSHYFDAGVDQKIPIDCRNTAQKDCATLDLGLDAYYKIATDLLDNGQFGQALVLSAFNYAHGVSQGVEFSAKYHNGNFQAYGNLAVGQEKATDIVSNQFLFDNATPQADLGGLTELQYLDSHWVYTDHNQYVTGSAGLSYRWDGTTISADMIYGSGLRTGDANIDTEAPYAQFNVGVARDFVTPDGPVTVRFDVVNVLDTVYQIRSGTGIGVFAPQYGPRRGYFLGLKKKICTDATIGDCNATPDDRRPHSDYVDLPSAPLSGPYDWTGLYLGLNAGGAFAANSTSASGGGISAAASDTLSGFIGGAQIGANYQTGPLVMGFEADYDASTQGQALPASVLSGSNEMPWVATLRGRLGVAFGPTLIYATAGGAGVEIRSPNLTLPAGSTSTTVTHGAWTAGAGLEYGLTDHLSARLEYLYLDTSDIMTGVIGPPATTITSHLKDNLVRAALNYRFAVPAASVLVSKN